MIKIIIILSIFCSQVYADSFKLEKLIDGFNKPWSLSFINKENVLVTEKSGDINFVNLNKKKIEKIEHNLDVLEDGQGGLLDILYKDNIVFVSYSENRSNGMSSTSVARAYLNKTKLNFKNIFRAEPPINSGYHFGSRLEIKNKHLYITAGEEAKG